MKRSALFLLSICLSALLQAQVSKTLTVTAGGLASQLTASEKATVTNLTLKGSIDARDFKTLRDDMPALSALDLSGSDIAAFSGSGGTDLAFISASYPENEIPTSGLRFKEGLISVVLPLGATSIAKCGFEACLDLKTISFPKALQNIGSRAFENCPSLVITAIPSTVNSIGASAFEDCRSLLTLTLPNSITTIDYGTFENCNNLKSITIPASVTEIGESAFEDCRKLKTITIPSSVKWIGDYAFENCRELTTVSLPATLKTIGTGAFKDCRKLTSINLPSTLWFISRYTFEDCYALTSITVPSSIEEFGKEVFSGCSALTSLYIPPLANEITDETFVECNAAITVDAANPYYSSLDGCLYNKSKSRLISCPGSKTGEFTLPSTVDTIGKGAFVGCTKLTSLVIPSSVKRIYGSPFDNCSASVKVNTGNPNYSSIDGLLFNKKQDTLFYCPDGKAGDYTLPSTVKVVAKNAFKHCDKLNTVTIPESVAFIEQDAFSGSSAKIIVLPENQNFSSTDGVLFNKARTSIIHCPVTQFGSYSIPSTVRRILRGAFEDCGMLSTVLIPETVTNIEKSAFEDCYNLESVNIPSSIDTIEARAFEDCKKLTSLTIPASVDSLGNNVFQGCSKLRSIYAKRAQPIKLDEISDVFYGIDKDSCILYVGVGSKRAYQLARQWKNFRITEEGPKDGKAPTSKVLPLPETTPADSVLLKWEGTDPEGSAITYTLYVSVNGAAFSLWKTTSGTQAVFSGQYGNSYGFYSLATDASGNQEAPKTKAEATIKMVQSVEIPIAVISQKWDDVLICHNTESKFTSYQWYKNGELISGGTRQFYQEIGGLNGSYYVQVTTTDEKVGISNVLEFGASAKSMKVYPNPLEENQEYTVEITTGETDLTGGAIMVSNIKGQLIASCNNLQSRVKLNGLARGVYMVKVQFANGETLNEKLIVK